MNRGSTSSRYLITTAFMGFGHLRAAHNLASLGNGSVVRVDREPLVSLVDKFVWNVAQKVHTFGSLDAESRNRFLFQRFDELMKLPDDHTPPSRRAAEFIFALNKVGVWKNFSDSLAWRTAPVIHTFYLPAMVSVYRDFRGANFLLLCDADFHRVWVPRDAKGANLKYFVPLARSADRLVSYGVDRDKIFVTGFPLPVSLTGDGNREESLSDFEMRCKRLTPNSGAQLTVMFSFSGAGAYSSMLADLISNMADDLKEERVRIIVSCGSNANALQNTLTILSRFGVAGLPVVQTIYDDNLYRAFDKFNAALKDTDVMITKPGELVFYAALGLPMILLRPIGGHEGGNRSYLLIEEAALDIERPDNFSEWLHEKHRTGKLLALAHHGYERIPRYGTTEIDKIILG